MLPAALCTFEPRLHGQQFRRLAGAVRSKLFKCQLGLMAAERGPRRNAIDAVAPVMGNIRE